MDLPEGMEPIPLNPRRVVPLVPGEPNLCILCGPPGIECHYVCEFVLADQSGSIRLPLCDTHTNEAVQRGATPPED